MNTLENIIADKFVEVESRKQLRPPVVLEKSSFFSRPTLSLKSFLLDSAKSGIITEFKRKSPSKGLINGTSSVELVSKGYEQAGASALSILTDQQYFGGSTSDLELARVQVSCPILRKDFVVDEYQIVEAKSMGADCILLIAAALSPKKVKFLASFAQSLGLEVLLEVHNLEELEQSFCEPLDVVGVNNRNLKTFEVSLATSLELVDRIPKEVVKISESGISDPATLVAFRKAGFNGFLIGENFMKSIHPEQEAAKFIQEFRRLMKEKQLGNEAYGN
ncbi:MAG: indole-3-glycerol phosphate synthase TrpC [Bacteroidetes bacterium]|nr:indole-3-glycerol phosphate synthase TrpC [Bacteroidota bacterium]